MNILAFIGIVLGVVGVLQLIKLMGPQAKDKVLIYLRGLVTANLEPQPTGNDISPRPAPSPIPSTTDTDSSTSVNDASDSAIDPPSATDGSPVPIDSSKEGDEIDQVLTDADFEDFSGQHIPTIQVVSGFTQVVLDQSEESGPTGSQTASGADELYTKIQESVTRLEQQMQKLYELQFQQMNSLSSSSAQSADRNVAEENNTGASAGVESDFGSSLNDDNPLVGNGLTAQLSGEVGGFVDLIEAGGSLAAGAVIEMDLADAREEPIDDSVRGIEINQYFYSLLKTKEMTHSLVEAIRQGKSEKVVRHHTRQVGRSIDYYGQHRDANRDGREYQLVGGGVHIGQSVVGHGAPACLRGADAEADEAEEALDKDRLGDCKRSRHGERPRAVWQDLLNQYPVIALSDGARRHHVVHPRLVDDFAAGETRHREPVGDAEREVDRNEVRRKKQRHVLAPAHERIEILLHKKLKQDHHQQ